MNREGVGILVGMVLLTVILLAGAVLTTHVHLQVFAAIAVLLTLLVVVFFRDPERDIPDQAGLILSPADGKVVGITEVDENEFLDARVNRISIFLSVFDVHVNRIPLSGRIKYFKYQKGSFVNALKAEASEVNEQTIIGIEAEGQTKTVKILFKQIAGLIARRIVCDIREGNKVKSGERFGMIKFGSRVDIFLPTNVEIKVQLNQRVKGGESIIGVLPDEI